MYNNFVSVENEWNPNNDYELPHPPSDSVSSVGFSPKGNFFVAGAWDNTIRCWEVKVGMNASVEAKAIQQSESPILSCSWSEDGMRVFSGGCDTKAKCWDLQSNTTVQVAQHDLPIKYVSWLPDKRILLTGSWDKTIKYWDCRSSSPVLSVQLPDKLYCADVRDNLVVVGTAERHIVIYNLNDPSRPYKTLESPLKFQSRCVKTFPDKTGFALGSIEGRVAVQYIEPSDASKNFAFKCHRIKSSIYAVNDIAFSPHGTFATLGADGTFHFWDKDSKTRLKAFKNCNMPLTTAEFNPSGTIFAYAVSYDWSQGASAYDQGKMKPRIFFHDVKENEVKPKASSTKW